MRVCDHIIVNIDIGRIRVSLLELAALWYVLEDEFTMDHFCFIYGIIRFYTLYFGSAADMTI
jgi:hypothetical protein